MIETFLPSKLYISNIHTNKDFYNITIIRIEKLYKLEIVHQIIDFKKKIKFLSFYLIHILKVKS